MTQKKTKIVYYTIKFFIAPILFCIPFTIFDILKVVYVSKGHSLEETMILNIISFAFYVASQVVILIFNFVLFCERIYRLYQKFKNIIEKNKDDKDHYSSKVTKCTCCYNKTCILIIILIVYPLIYFFIHFSLTIVYLLHFY